MRERRPCQAVDCWSRSLTLRSIMVEYVSCPAPATPLVSNSSPGRRKQAKSSCRQCVTIWGVEKIQSNGPAHRRNCSRCRCFAGAHMQPRDTT